MTSCVYLGSEGGFRHELRGYLAGFSYVRGSNENAEVLRCLQECAEALKVLLIFLPNNGMSLNLFFKFSLGPGCVCGGSRFGDGGQRARVEGGGGRTSR